MNEQEKTHWPKVLQILVPIISASIALISLLVGIAARKKELTCTLVSSSTIVSVNPGGIHPDIKVEFRGQPIGTLSKLTFSLKNSGSGAIRVDDIKEAVRITFPSTSKVLNANVEGTSPQHFTFSVRLDPAVNTVICDFPLLNPGDEAFFSAYVQSGPSIKPLFEGRVVDVSQMLYIDRSETERNPLPRFLSSHSVRSVLRWVLVAIYCGLALFFAGVWIFELARHVMRSLWMKKHRIQFAKALEEIMREEAQKPKEHRRSDWSIDWDAAYKVREKGAPKRPLVIWRSFAGLLGGSLLLLALSAIGAITASLAFVALRG